MIENQIDGTQQLMELFIYLVVHIHMHMDRQRTYAWNEIDKSPRENLGVHTWLDFVVVFIIKPSKTNS